MSRPIAEMIAQQRDQVAGSLGSAQRLKYTTVGDTVNIASKLKSFDKDLVTVYRVTGPMENE
jgi:hypothetical protein